MLVHAFIITHNNKYLFTNTVQYNTTILSTKTAAAKPHVQVPGQITWTGINVTWAGVNDTWTGINVTSTGSKQATDHRQQQQSNDVILSSIYKSMSTSVFTSSLCSTMEQLNCGSYVAANT